MDNGHSDTAVAAPGNGDSTPEERGDIGSQLTGEQREHGETGQAIGGQDERIGELESQLEQARSELAGRQDELDNAWVEMTALREAKDEAVSGYRDALRLAHPELPPDLIRGETPEELAASVEATKALVEKVRSALRSEKDAARIPAGAPVSSGPDLTGLSPREKIAAGIASPAK